MKPNVLDSSAWIECLDGGANAAKFKPVLDALPRLIVPSIVLTEVRKVILRQRTLDQANQVTQAMLTGIIVPVDAEVAIAAADMAHRHKLPLADSIIYAITLSHGSTLWTQDEHFEDLPHVRYFPKPKP